MGAMDAQPARAARLTPADVGMGRLFWKIRDAVIVGEVPGGTVALWNPAAETLFGYTADEIVGKPLATLVPERLRAAHQAGLERYARLGHGAVVDSPVPVELPALRRDGTEFWIELRLSPIERLEQVADGRRLVLAILRDCTERKQLETERALKAQLEGVLLTARTFEHELNSKLTSTIAYAQLTLRDPSLPPHLRERVEGTLWGAREAAAVIRRLLDLTELTVIDWSAIGQRTINLDPGANPPDAHRPTSEAPPAPDTGRAEAPAETGTDGTGSSGGANGPRS